MLDNQKRSTPEQSNIRSKNGCLSSTDVRHGVGGGRRYNIKFNAEPAGLILDARSRELAPRFI